MIVPAGVFLTQAIFKTREFYETKFKLTPEIAFGYSMGEM